MYECSVHAHRRRLAHTHTRAFAVIARLRFVKTSNGKSIHIILPFRFVCITLASTISLLLFHHNFNSVHIRLPPKTKATATATT